MDKILFRVRLERAMKLRNINQKNLARATGISSSAISQYVLGQKAPRENKIDIIASVLGVSKYWLIGESKNMIESDVISQNKKHTFTDNEILEMHKKDEELYKKILIDQIHDLKYEQVLSLLNNKIDMLSSIDELDMRLLVLFNKLKKEGKDKLLEYAELLNEVDRLLDD